MPSKLITDILEVLDQHAGGVHPGFRPVHARGVMCSGTFTPSPEAGKLTRAPHANRPSTPLSVRFSLTSGVPTAAENDPEATSPQGIAVRFHLGIMSTRTSSVGDEVTDSTALWPESRSNLLLQSGPRPADGWPMAFITPGRRTTSGGR